jgi:hypothetical protein
LGHRLVVGDEDANGHARVTGSRVLRVKPPQRVTVLGARVAELVPDGADLER